MADPDKNLSCQFMSGGLYLKADRLVKDQEEFELIGYQFKVIHTPGHTCGSSLLLYSIGEGAVCRRYTV